MAKTTKKLTPEQQREAERMNKAYRTFNEFVAEHGVGFVVELLLG